MLTSIGTLSKCQGFSILVKAFIGAGILALPQAFSKSGVLGPLVLLPITAYGVKIGMRWIIDAWEHLTLNREVDSESLNPIEMEEFTDAYGSLTKYYLGNFGLISYRIGISGFQFGVCLAYVSLIGKSMADVLPQVEFRMWCGMAFVVLAVMVQVKDQHLVAKFASVSNLLYLVIIVLVIANGIKFGNVYDGDNKPDIFFTSGFFALFGTCVFSMEIIGNVLIVYQSLREKEAMHDILNLCFFICAIIFGMFGFFAAMLYGDTVQSPISEAMTVGWMSDTVKILLTIIMIPSFLLQIRPILSYLEVWIFANREDKLDFKIGILRVAVVAIICGVAIVWRNFGQIISIIGSICGSYVGIILPALIHNVASWQQYIKDEAQSLLHVEELREGRWMIFFKASALIIFGVAAGTLGTYFAIVSP